MTIEQFSRRMIEIMPQCIRGFSRYESNYLSRGEISLPQFWTLEHLSRGKGCLMSTLASYLGISRPAATGLINRLINQGLAKRESGPNDRREVKVSITAKGKKIVSNVWEQKRRSLTKVFSHISPKSRRDYLRILEQVADILDRQCSERRKINCAKIKTLLIACVVFLGFVLSVMAKDSDEPLTHATLKECYQMALKRSETVAIQAQMIKEAEGRFTQYLNHLLPNVSYSYTDKIQNGSGGSAFTLSEVPEQKFVFSQPIFSGFKDLARLQGSKIEKRQRLQEKIRAEQLLFTDVSDAFYLLLNYQDDFDALKTTQQALQERVDELKKREELGRSRSSEIANAEARLSRIEADLEQMESNREISRQLLEFLTGRSIASIIDMPIDQGSQKNLAENLEQATNRSDVLAAKEAWGVAKKHVVIARGGYWPTVSAEGDYYTKRVGNAADVDWDATLSISMPITTAGITMGEVKEAGAKEREAELKFSQAQRNAVLEINNAFTRHESAIKRLTAIEKALAAAEKNYKLQMEDYRFNLVNNLDVLQALADLQDARRDSIAAKTEAKRSYWDLKVKTGDITNDPR